MIYLVVLVKIISVNDRSGVKIRVVSREGGGERVERSLFIFVLCVFSLF